MYIVDEAKAAQITACKSKELRRKSRPKYEYHQVEDVPPTLSNLEQKGNHYPQFEVW